MFTQNREATKDVYVTQSDTINIAVNNKHLNIGGTFGYTINKPGAKVLVDYIEKNGIRHGIDYVMKICPELKTWEVRPQLVFSEWYETPGQNVDSDIQKNFTGLNFDSIIDPAEYFDFKAGLDQMSNDCYHHANKTIYELMEVLTLNDIKEIKKPIIIYNIDNFFDGFINYFDELSQKGFLSYKLNELNVRVSNNPIEVINFITQMKR